MCGGTSTHLQKIFFLKSIVLQRNFTQLIERRDPALAMGEIGRMVPLLPVGDDFQHRLGVEFTSG